MNRDRPLLLAIAGLLLFPVLTKANENAYGFVEMSYHYDSIRRALLADSLLGVSDHAKALQDKASSLRQNISAQEVGVSAEDFEIVVGALEEIASAAQSLAETDELEPAREELFLLTRPMAKYRQLSGDETTIVAYCSMAQKAWIQPEGELGNPYMGQRMPRCGEVVAR